MPRRLLGGKESWNGGGEPEAEVNRILTTFLADYMKGKRWCIKKYRVGVSLEMVSQVRLIISGLRQLFDQVIDHQSNKERKAKRFERRQQ